MTFEKIQQAALGTDFEGKLIHTLDREFPDIVAAGYFGVEVKATRKDAWTSIGNSVLESSRVKSVEKIYIFFGKLGGLPDVMFRNYEDCMRGIAVTHYPRYQIDMQLAAGNSIFELMNVDYNTMRTSANPVAYVRKYYKTKMREGDALWWVDDDSEDAQAHEPVIRNFSSLDAETKDQIKAELFVLYPEIFSNSTNKFKQVPAYLAARYGVVSANVRDIFTAGGKVTLQDDKENEFQVPQVVGELVRLAPLINQIIAKSSTDDLRNAWRRHVDDGASVKAEWLYELNKHSAFSAERMRLSDIFEKSSIKS